MNRITVFCIVEGQTENAVLKALLSEHLAARGVDFHAPIIKTKGGRGGVKFLNVEELLGEMRVFLKDRRQPFVTTFFDYYGLPTAKSRGWSFAAEAKAKLASHSVHQVVEAMEQEIKRLALEGVDSRNALDRCFPYIQLHELEAIFFAEPDKLAAGLEKPTLTKIFQQAVIECEGCEHINDRPQSAPSKRIEAAAPHYIKGRSAAAHAPIIAKRLDLNVVRQNCPRFGAWIERLEKLGG